MRTVEELMHSSLPVIGVLATAALAESPRGAALARAIAGRGVECAEVSEQEFQSAADTEHPQGVLAIAEVPARPLDAVQLGSRVLVLDAIQDPGNVGTLVRTAAALGAASIVALPGTADVWSAKAVRSAAGAHFRVALATASPEELISVLRAAAMPLWGAAADGVSLKEIAPPPRLALAVGNEGSGVSPAVRAAAEQIVALPMSAGVESLNVAVAAGIILYALRP